MHRDGLPVPAPFIQKLQNFLILDFFRLLQIQIQVVVFQNCLVPPAPYHEFSHLYKLNADCVLTVNLFLQKRVVFQQIVKVQHGHPVLEILYLLYQSNHFNGFEHLFELHFQSDVPLLGILYE